MGRVSWGRVLPYVAAAGTPVLLDLFLEQRFDLSNALYGLLAVLLAVTLLEVVPLWSGWARVGLWMSWARVRSWALAAFAVVLVAFVAIGVVAGALSTVRGVAWRMESPWGLVWATTGIRGEGVGFEFGSGFMLTPVFAALIAAAVCSVLVWRRSAAPE